MCRDNRRYYFSLKERKCSKKPSCINNPQTILNVLSGRCNKLKGCRDGRPTQITGLCPKYCKYGIRPNGSCKSKSNCKYGAIQDYDDNVVRCRNKKNILKNYAITKRELRGIMRNPNDPPNPPPAPHGRNKESFLDEFEDWAKGISPNRIHQDASEEHRNKTNFDRTKKRYVFATHNRRRLYDTAKKIQRRVRGNAVRTAYPVTTEWLRLLKRLSDLRSRYDAVRLPENPTDNQLRNYNTRRDMFTQQMNAVRATLDGDMRQDAQDQEIDPIDPIIVELRHLEPGHTLPAPRQHMFKCGICQLTGTIDANTQTCGDHDNTHPHYFHKLCIFIQYLEKVHLSRFMATNYNDTDILNRARQLMKCGLCNKNFLHDIIQEFENRVRAFFESRGTGYQLVMGPRNIAQHALENHQFVVDLMRNQGFSNLQIQQFFVSKEFVRDIKIHYLSNEIFEGEFQMNEYMNDPRLPTFVIPQ
jgi:hypothetical protein